MTLALVQAIAGTVLWLIASWTGLVIGVALLLPKQAERASAALTRSPAACFGGGLAMTFLLVILFAVARSPFPLLELFAVTGLLLLGTVLSIGAAGTARVMAGRITDMSGGGSAFSSLVRGSVVYSLAMGFPLIGWLIFLPFAVIFGLGAGAAALLPVRDASAPPFIGGKPDFDLADRRGAV